MPQHEIRIRHSNNDAAVVIDGNTVNVNEDLAVLLWNAIAEYLNDHCVDCKWNSPYDAKYIMSNLTVKIKRINNEITFIFEE
jgi:hypothetical protein